jgi:hypothetical protein
VSAAFVSRRGLDDGTLIAESVAICRYFEILRPDPPLFSVGALGLAGYCPYLTLGVLGVSKLDVLLWNTQALNPF